MFVATKLLAAPANDTYQDLNSTAINARTRDDLQPFSTPVRGISQHYYCYINITTQPLLQILLLMLLLVLLLSNVTITTSTE